LVSGLPWRSVEGHRQAERIARTDARIWLAFLLALWQIYFLFMIPTVGRTRVVDLFFPTYVTLEFLAGHLLDIFDKPRWRFLPRRS
jgi:succinate-acetate transporter protein